MNIFLFSNQLTAKSINKHEGYNFCDSCHISLYAPKVLPSLSSITVIIIITVRSMAPAPAVRPLRRGDWGRRGSWRRGSADSGRSRRWGTERWGWGWSRGDDDGDLLQPDEDDGYNYHMLKIRATMEIAPEKAYCVWWNATQAYSDKISSRRINWSWLYLSSSMTSYNVNNNE